MSVYKVQGYQKNEWLDLQNYEKICLSKLGNNRRYLHLFMMDCGSFIKCLIEREDNCIYICDMNNKKRRIIEEKYIYNHNGL